MKKVAVFSLPAYGHVNPTLSVAQVLSQKGYDVIYYSSEEFRERIEKAGIRYRSYRIQERVDLRISNVVDIATTILAISEKYIPILIQELEKEKPDYIIHDQLCFHGKIAAHYFHIPAASLQTSFLITKRVTFTFPQVALMYLKQIMRQGKRHIRNMNKYRKIVRKYHLKTRGFDDLFLNEEKLNIVFTSRLLQPKGKLFGKKYIFVGSSISASSRLDKNTIGTKLKTNKPIIYISLGTIFNNDLSFFHTCVQAFKDSPYFVIMSIGHRFTEKDLPAVPSNMYVQNYVPQLEILKKASIFITHAGMNSVTESLSFSVPMICIPQTGEQMLNALRIQQIGAGVVLEEEERTPERLLSLVTQMLNTKSFVQHIQPVRESLLDAGGYERAAEEIITYFHKSK